MGKQNKENRWRMKKDAHPGTWCAAHLRHLPLVCASLLFAAQLIAFFVLNLTRTEALFDFDSALVFRHAREVWERGKLFLHDFNLPSSLELDCAAFWAAPLSAITGNVALSYTLVHAVLLGIVLLLCSLLLRREGVKPLFRLLAYLFLLTPYTVGQLEYANMLFCSAGQYGFRLIVLLFLFYFTGLDLKSTPKKQWIPLLAVYAFFLGTTTLSCGNYVPVMLLGPFVLARGIAWLRDPRQTLWDASTVFLCLSGLAMFACLVVREGRVPSAATVLCASEQLADNVLGCFTGILILLGTVPQVPGLPVFSLPGLVAVAKWFCLAGAVWAVYTALRRQPKLRGTRFVCAALCVMVCHLAVLLLTQTRYGSNVFESRYHLFWLAAGFLLLAACLQPLWERAKNKRLQYGVCAAVFAVLATANLDGFRQLFRLTHDPQDVCAQVCDVAAAQDVSTVLFYGVQENGMVPHLLYAKAPSLRCMQIAPDFLGVDALDWYKNAGDAMQLGKANLLFTTPEAFGALPPFIRDRYRAVGETAGMHCYRTDENPCDFSCGFPLWRADESVDYPYTPGYQPTHARLLPDRGVLETDGTAGCVLRGDFPVPADVQTRVYALRLMYAVTSHGDGAVGEVQLLADGVPVAAGVLEAGQNVLLLDEIRLPVADRLTLTVTETDGTVLQLEELRFSAMQEKK